MGSCINLLRTIVFVFNILFWLSGIVILGLGLWLLFDPSSSDFFHLHSAHPGSFRLIAVFLVIAGAIVTVISCCGCCGAWKLNQGALCCFFICLIIVFCLELAAAFMAYSRSDELRNYIESSMHDTIRNRYASDKKYKAAFDTVQTSFECCGVKSYADWLSASWDRKGLSAASEDGKMEHGIGSVGGGRGNGFGIVPASCCNEHGRQVYPTNCGTSFNQAPLSTYTEFIHNKGCADVLYDTVSSNLDLLITVCVVAGCIQVALE
ncbi:hypothetical protein WR25_06298 isoform B [Diploscapter pachys]|uniref:Tetraspanin n=2 Tax=Diploscapter pachys TaxID=2018661 RepID=A0A2A2JZ86_9BILA|nr:hypothetical protein WR25_06298 isoform B [Diploscapter pachys]